MKFKTLNELKQYAETMEQTESWQVGASYTNHQRAVYIIGTIQILIDTVMPYNWMKPTREWYWTGDSMAKEQALNFAARYNARAEEAYYTDCDEYQLIFDNLNDLLEWVFDTQYNRLAA